MLLWAMVTLRDEGLVLGYCVAMAGLDEMHLLNLSVRAEAQGQGHGWRLLDHLVAHCRRSSRPSCSAR